MKAIISDLKQDLRDFLRESRKIRAHEKLTHIIIFTEDETSEPEFTMLFKDQIESAFEYLYSRGANAITVMELGQIVKSIIKED